MSLRLRFLLIILSISALFVINVIALKLYLYWTYPWLNKVMHLFGGIMAGNLVLIGRHAASVKRHVIVSSKGYLLIAVLGGLLIGLLWEVSEFALGFSQLGPNFLYDTSFDLLMDVVGAVLAYISWIKIPHKTT